jgi:hypothetical protein
MTQMTQMASRWLAHPRWPLVVCAAAVVLTLPAVPSGFVADDYVHRAILLRLPEFQVRPLDLFAFIGVSDGADAIRRVSMPWWAAPDLKLAFWRPLTALTHALDYALWPDAPSLCTCTASHGTRRSSGSCHCCSGACARPASRPGSRRSFMP